MTEKSLHGQTVGALTLSAFPSHPYYNAIKQGARQLASLGYHNYTYVGQNDRNHVVWEQRFGDGKRMLLATKPDGTIVKS